jgi:hypothetical protein
MLPGQVLFVFRNYHSTQGPRCLRSQKCGPLSQLHMNLFARLQIQIRTDSSSDFLDGGACNVLRQISGKLEVKASSKVVS